MKKFNFGLNFVNLDIDLDIRVQNNLELEIEKYLGIFTALIEALWHTVVCTAINEH